MRARELNEEVLVADGPLVEVTAADVQELKQRAAANRRRRVRICAHPDSDASLHEMLIVHVRGAYIPPHKHEGKSESVHVVEGEADVVFFDDDGAVTEVVPIGPYGSSRRFYYRLDDAVYHTLLVTSDFLVIHEVTNGPFRREETTFAPWAPDEADAPAIAAFQLELAASLARRERT